MMSALQFQIVVAATGDRAEADCLDAALIAASTLVDDRADHLGTQGALAATRRSVIILRDGKHDAIATTLARSGARRSPDSPSPRRPPRRTDPAALDAGYWDSNG